MPWYLEDSGVSTYACRVSTGGVRGEREGRGRGGGVPFEHLYLTIKEINTFIAKDTTYKSIYYKIV